MNREDIEVRDAEIVFLKKSRDTVLHTPYMLGFLKHTFHNYLIFNTTTNSSKLYTTQNELLWNPSKWLMKHELIKKLDL